MDGGRSTYSNTAAARNAHVSLHIHAKTTGDHKKVASVMRPGRSSKSASIGRKRQRPQFREPGARRKWPGPPPRATGGLLCRLPRNPTGPRPRAGCSYVAWPEAGVARFPRVLEQPCVLHHPPTPSFLQGVGAKETSTNHGSMSGIRFARTAVG